MKKLVQNPNEYSAVMAFRWADLKAILDNRIVASTNFWVLFLPAVMILTKEFPDRLQVFPWNAEEPLELVLDVPFNWYLLYFSAVLFFIARLTYFARCPTFLKSYSSAADAQADGITSEILVERTFEHLTSYQNVKLHQLSEEHSAIEKVLELLVSPNTDIEDLIASNEYTYGAPEALPSSVVLRHRGDSFAVQHKAVGVTETTIHSVTLLAWRLIALQNIFALKSRYFCSILVVVGAILLSIPFLQGFGAVWESFVATF